MDVKLRTLPRQVAEVLTRRVVSGDLVGGFLPSEKEICDEFGVSRAVAREALKILHALNMVEISQGRRVTLRPAEEWDYLDPLLIEWLPPEETRRLLRELHEMRLMLEPAIAAQAATRLTEAELGRLAELLAAMAGCEGDPDQYLRLDLEFHMAVCRATRNRFLDRFMYSSRCWQSASRRRTNQGPRALPVATEHHRAILDSLTARDPAGAESAMRYHLMRNPLLREPESGAEMVQPAA